MIRRPQPLLLLTAIALTACSVPKKHNAAELLGQSDVCFRASPEMRLAKAFKPGILSGYQWDLQVLSDWRTKPNWWDVSTWKAFSDGASGGLEALPDVLKVSSATPVSLGTVQTTWDFENGYRIVIFGIAHTPYGGLKFMYQKTATKPFDPQKKLQGMFQQCNE
jgi:hypothetical protein